MLSPERAAESLLAPGARERWSVLSGTAVLVVDFGLGGEVLDAQCCARLREQLRSLPCITIAVARESSDGAAPLVDRFDVVLDDTGDVEAVTRAVRRNPLASLALVQLLRLGEGLAPEHALTCESLVYSTLQAGPELRSWLAARPSIQARSPSEGPAVRVLRKGARLEIRLARPEVRNALSVEMRDALCEALELVASDPTLEEVSLLGEGPDFCSGGYLDEFGTAPDPATAHAVRSTRSPARALLACGDRVRARLHGACVGAGIELPAFCGRISAASNAFFQLPELGMGLVPGAGGTVSLCRRIGRQRTAWLALSGARIDAATALAWGLVDELDPGAAA